MSVGWDEVFPEPAPVPGRFVTRRRAVVAALVTAIAMAVGGVAWLLTYSPLEPGSLTGAPGGSAAWSAADTGVGDVVYYVSAGKPGVFEIGFDVENSGRLPFTLQGPRLADRLHAWRAWVAIRRSRSPVARSDARSSRSSPSRSTRATRATSCCSSGSKARMVCTQSGASFVPSDPALRFRTLGIVPGEQTVPLPFTVVGMCGNELPPDYNARAGR